MSDPLAVCLIANPSRIGLKKGGKENRTRPGKKGKKKIEHWMCVLTSSCSKIYTMLD